MRDLIETERLVLRAFAEADAEAITQALQDREIAAMIPRMPWPYKRSDAEHFLTAILPNEPQSYAIEHQGHLIGAVRAGGALGYWLKKAVWGQGFATEAARAAVVHRFDTDRSTLHSGHRLGNARSRRVLQKLGFRDTGQSPCYSHVDQTDIIRQEMALTYADWEARP